GVALSDAAPAATETLSLHDALPISAILQPPSGCGVTRLRNQLQVGGVAACPPVAAVRRRCMLASAWTAFSALRKSQCRRRRSFFQGINQRRPRENSPPASSLAWPNQGIRLRVGSVSLA